MVNDMLKIEIKLEKNVTDVFYSSTYTLDVDMKKKLIEIDEKHDFAKYHFKDVKSVKVSED